MYIHNLNPVIFDFGILSLRWYSLAYIFGILAGWVLAKRFFINNQGVKTKFDDYVTYLIFGIIIGGRLGYVLFYNLDYYFKNPLDIFKIWQGGMSFHGGVIGIIIISVWFANKNKHIVFNYLDVISLVAPIGIFFGRISNFINAELWGRPTDMPWGVVFPGEMALDCGLKLGICARHPSQLYEAALEGLILGIFLIYMVFYKSVLKKPGLLTGLFFVGYGASRYFVEFFRQPDAQFQSPDNPIGYVFYSSHLGITMGQILSLPMIIIGFILILRATNRSKL